MVRSVTEVIKTTKTKQKMENPKQQLVERLQSANNILVTVSANPSVDQLSAAIGLTLMLNKMGKHGTAVFSGKVPSTIEFLKPEKTIEKNTDSLRDFIIALDKSKADKLRYKVEDSHVKIFITPYRTSITDKDLEFSQGDFNVEVVVALGVHDQKDLDKAITSHGRILHDATTISMTNGSPSTMGSINWDQSDMSSLCEMVGSLADDLQANLLDDQTATALMTGIVAETEQFRNAKTTPHTMNLSATLMAAGANQQLIATQLEETEEPDTKAGDENSSSEDEKSSKDAENTNTGALLVEHKNDDAETEPSEVESAQEDPGEELHIEEQGIVEPFEEDSPEEPSSVVEGGGSLMLEPPTLGGKLTANSEPEQLDPATDPLGVDTNRSPLLEHHDKPAGDDQPALPDFSDVQDEAEDPGGPSLELPSDLPLPVTEPVPDTPADLGIAPVENPQVDPNNEGHDQTLAELEAVVQDSANPNTGVELGLPDITPSEPTSQADLQSPDLDGARDAVSDALASLGQPLEPIQSLNAQPFDINDQIGDEPELSVPEPSVAEFVIPDAAPEPSVPEFTMPDNLVPPLEPAVDPTAGSIADPSAPPTVPPPFMPNLPGLDPSAPFTEQSDQNKPL